MRLKKVEALYRGYLGQGMSVAQAAEKAMNSEYSYDFDPLQFINHKKKKMGWHAYGILSNKTDRDIIVTIPYVGFCHTIMVPANTHGYIFEIESAHWYGLECRQLGTGLTVKGARGVSQLGLAAIAGHAYGGDLVVQDGQLKLVNEVGLDPVPLTGNTSDCFKQAANSR